MKSPAIIISGPTVPGCDVSHWNDPVQWGKAQFAWIKCTDGLGGDREFLNHAIAAKTRGIYRGAYHYFRDTVDPIDQAVHFIHRVGENMDIGYAIDWEEYPESSEQVLAMLEAMHRRTRRPPVLYSNLAFLESIPAADLSPFAVYPLWLADLRVGGPHLPAPWKSIMFWQYQFGARSPLGMSCDLDIFCGGLGDLKSLIK